MNAEKTLTLYNPVLWIPMATAILWIPMEKYDLLMVKSFPMNPYGQVWLVYGEISPMDPYGQVFPNESLWAG